MKRGVFLRGGSDSQNIFDEAIEKGSYVGETENFSAEDLKSIENKLYSAGLKMDSPEWQTIKNVKMEDFFKVVSPVKEETFGFWRQDSGLLADRIRDLAGKDYQLGNMSAGELRRIQEVAEMIGESNPNLDSSVGKMTLEQFVARS